MSRLRVTDDLKDELLTILTELGEATTNDILAKGKRKWENDSDYGAVRMALIQMAQAKQIDCPYGRFDERSPEKDQWFVSRHRSIENDQQIWKIPNSSPPEEVDNPTTAQITEGKAIRIFVNSYERSPVARRKCLEEYGYKCCVCEFDFANFYGVIGVGFIHVHHLKPLSELKKNYKVDPIKDLRPVCANCHAMLHTKRSPHSIEQLKQIIKENKQK